ncbi:MAG: AbrB/MazE/SpoVT family DNA-binding domain-containing protein [Candidatus Methanoplasma sp.]|jgi:phosphate uptake regulator|nr:AbrB/MazE/SpoVT family DNA-binding domain-containing protein [Candidatus Methanoplasma sp.]
MDVRRVQITGGSSFMITLPKDWASSVGLKKNDTIGVQTQPDGSLSLYPKGTTPLPKRSTKVIDVTNIKDRGFLFRQLIGAYISGHSMILVKSETTISSAVASVIANFVQTSIGLEIVEADDTHILITDLIEHDVLGPKRTIERMRLIVKSMMRDIYDAAFTGDLENIKDMESRDMQIDRIFWLISRQCSIQQKDVAASHRMTVPLSELAACLSVSKILESIGDHTMTMSSYIQIMNDHHGTGWTDENAKDFGNRVTNLFTNAVNSWINKDIMLAEQTIKEAEGIVNDVSTTSKQNVELSTATAPSKEIVLFSSKRIAEYCKSIAELTFNVAAMD